MEDAALAIASLIGTLIIGGTALLISGQNSARVDRAMEFSINQATFDQLNRRVVLLEDDNRKLRDAVEACEREKLTIQRMFIREQEKNP